MAADHPLKMSVCNIQYDETAKSYKIDLRLYADDFLSTQTTDFNAVLKAGNLAPSPIMVRDYIKEHLQITINGEEQRLKFDKMRVEGLTIYTEWEMKKAVPPQEISEIEIEDSILVDDFKNQNNVVNLKFDQKNRKTLLFNHAVKNRTVQF